MDKRDALTELADYTLEMRNYIFEGLSKIQKDGKEFPWMTKYGLSRFNGPKRYNRRIFSGIQFKELDGTKKCKYYLSMTSFDFDSKSGNVHTYPGRICIMVSKDGSDAGNPNEKITCIYRISYRDTLKKKKTILNSFPHNGYDWNYDEIDNRLRIYNTGYSLFSEDSPENVILLAEKGSENNIDEFIRMVMSFIEKMESMDVK